MERPARCARRLPGAGILRGWPWGEARYGEWFQATIVAVSDGYL